MKKITNLDEVKRVLYNMIFGLEMEERDYQTDIYAYYDEETGKVELEYFENVGGNSWLDDDHITVYTDKPHYDKLEDEYDFADDDEKENFIFSQGGDTIRDWVDEAINMLEEEFED